MGIKDELKHGLKNIIQDVDLSVTKTWEVTYKGQKIRVENSLEHERLFINEKMVDEKINRSLLNHIKPFSQLTGTIELDDGTKEKVSVRLGGIIKLTVHIKVGRKTVLKEKMSIDILPWENKMSIVQYIEEQIAEHGKIVNHQLPDIDYIYDYDETVQPGYLDYVGYEGPLPFFEKNLVKHIKRLIEHPTTKRRRMIYEKVNDEYVRMFGGELLYYIQAEELDEQRLQEEALWFLEHAAHREVLKFALLLIGLTDVEPYKDKLYNIALHEEFTSYALLGLSRLEHDAHYMMSKLANELHGWGKVAVMHHLDAITTDEKMWFLEQTFADDDMNEAVALVIANEAEIDVLLMEDNINRDVFTQISLILSRLLKVKKDGLCLIDDYSFAPLLLRKYVKYAKNLPNDPTVQETIAAIKRYIEHDEEIWQERFEHDWKPHEREWLINELLHF